MSHPYRKSYLKRQEFLDHLQEPGEPSSPRFTHSITANIATLNLKGHKIDRNYRHQLKTALNGALGKGVNIVNLDLSGCDGPDSTLVSTLLTLGKSVKIDVLPCSN